MWAAARLGSSCCHHRRPPLFGGEGDRCRLVSESGAFGMFEERPMWLPRPHRGGEDRGGGDWWYCPDADWEAATRGAPRAAFVRKLSERNMRNFRLPIPNYIGRISVMETVHTVMKASTRLFPLLLKSCLALSVACLGAGAHAGLFPKIMKQMPKELQGEYLLLARVNPDKSHEEFTTNALPFATVLSNRVVLADGGVRLIEAVARVTSKGTNVHLVSFEGKGSWIIAPAGPRKQFAVLQSTNDKPKAPPTMLLLSRKPSQR